MEQKIRAFDNKVIIILIFIVFFIIFLFLLLVYFIIVFYCFFIIILLLLLLVYFIIFLKLLLLQVLYLNNIESFLLIYLKQVELRLHHHYYPIEHHCYSLNSHHHPSFTHHHHRYSSHLHSPPSSTRLKPTITPSSSTLHYPLLPHHQYHTITITPLFPPSTHPHHPSRELLLVEETMKMMELLKDEEILTAKLVDDGDLQKKVGAIMGNY